MSEVSTWGAYQPQIEKTKTVSRKEIARQDAELILAEANSRKRLKEEEFLDEKIEGYTSPEVKHDLKTVERMKERFQEEIDDLAPEIKESRLDIRRKSDALENIIVKGGEELAWFSQSARVIHTSEFDDIFNGVDAVLEFEVEGETPQRIALAFDASMGFNFEVVEKKINRGVDKVFKGKMQVKYFQSQLDDYKGKLTTVIPIVLGLEGINSEKLIHFFAEFKRMQQNPYEVDMEKTISEAQNHPAQIIFLKEMLAQLKMHAGIFKRNNSFLKYEIEKIQTIVEKLLQDKQHISSGEFEQDRAYQTICQVCEKQAVALKK